MEKNKRIKNSILLGFISSLFIMIILLSIIFFKLKIDIEEIEAVKVTLKEDNDYYLNTSKTGISFMDFKSFVNSTPEIKKDLYIKSVVSSLSEDFYSENILNNTSSSFDDYISKKQKDVNSKQLELNLKEEKINKILPIYNDNINIGSNGIISDFHLVNKIESLFKTFNLSYGDKISINNISPVPGFESAKITTNIENQSSSEESELVQSETEVVSSENTSTKGIQSDIFFIPMNVNISGTKFDAQNFLHYLENIGRFDIVGNDIEIYKDDFIKNESGQNIIVYNDDFKDANNYNIYNNQLVNIKNIKFDNNFISNDIGLGEKVELDIEIEFYVRGIPNYKMQEFLNKFLSDYNKLQSEVDSKISKLKGSNKTEDKAKEEKLLKIKNYLLSIDSEVKRINDDLGNIDKLESIYKNTIDYNKNLINVKNLFIKI